MAILAAAALESDVAGLQVEFIVDDDDIGRGNREKLSQGRDGASGEVHIGAWLGNDQLAPSALAADQLSLHDLGVGFLVDTPRGARAEAFGQFGCGQMPDIVAGEFVLGAGVAQSHDEDRSQGSGLGVWGAVSVHRFIVAQESRGQT